MEFAWGGVEELAGHHDLCATGPALELALADGDPAIGRCASRVDFFLVVFSISCEEEETYFVYCLCVGPP